MPRIHPKPDVAQGLIRLLPEGRRRVLRHTRDCPVCRSRVRSDPSSLAAVRAQLREPGRLLFWNRSDDGYSIIVDRALHSLRGRLSDAAREQEAAPALLAELARHPAPRRAVMVRNSARFRSLALANAVLQASREATGKGAQQSQEWAELALEMADLLHPERYGVRMIEDARARSWAAIANARRIAGDFLGAERAFLAAEAHLRQGTRDPLERAQILSYKATLRRTQGRCDDALNLFRRALSIWLCAGEAQRAAESVISWSLLYTETGDLDQAIRLLREIDLLIHLRGNPRLSLNLRHNLIGLLLEADRVQEARDLLERSRDLYEKAGSPTFDVRRKWLEARIAFGLGELADAADLLLQVREELSEACNGHEAALCSLNLALVYGRMGKRSEAMRLASEAMFIYRAWRIPSKALASLIVYLQMSNDRPRSTQREGEPG